MICQVCEDAEAELQALIPVGKDLISKELCVECVVKEYLDIEGLNDKEELDE